MSKLTIREVATLAQDIFDKYAENYDLAQKLGSRTGKLLDDKCDDDVLMLCLRNGYSWPEVSAELNRQREEGYENY